MSQLLTESAALVCVALAFVVIYMLLCERQDKRRARHLEYLAGLEEDEPEVQRDVLAACKYCGRETRTINGLYVVACPCGADDEFKEMGS